MKIIFIALVTFFLLLSGGAMAATLTDTTFFTANGTAPGGDLDSYGGQFVNMLEGSTDWVSWTHHFVFDPPAASLINASLTVYLRDDERDALLNPATWDFALGYAESGQWAFGEVDTGAYNYDVNVRYLTDGTFSVTLASLVGDFYIDSSVLNINYNTASVPEPTTLLLLGCGLVSLAAFGRKRR